MSLLDDAITYFQSKGWTKEQAAGIAGNLSYESAGLDPKAVGDNGQAYGLAQWHYDRQAIFHGVKGKDIKSSSFQDQLDFVQWELTHTYAAAGNALKNATTVDDATKVFMDSYERPANSSSFADRLSIAKKALISSPSDVADANVDNGFSILHPSTWNPTTYINGKLDNFVTWLKSSTVALLVGLVGVIVIMLGLYQLIKQPASNVASAGANIGLKALGA